MRDLSVFGQEYAYTYTANFFDQDGQFVGDYDGYYSNTEWFPESEVKNYVAGVIVDSFKEKYPEHLGKRLVVKNIRLTRIEDIAKEAKTVITTNKLIEYDKY